MGHLGRKSTTTLVAVAVLVSAITMSAEAALTKSISAESFKNNAVTQKMEYVSYETYQPAFSIAVEAKPDAKVTYSRHVENKMTSQGLTRRLELTNNSFSLAQVTGYTYLSDLHNDLLERASQTYGISLSGLKEMHTDMSFGYHSEYAYQNDYRESTVEYDTDYYHLAPAVSWAGIKATAGYEVLGSDDGRIAFAKPRSSHHVFTKSADKFLTTPDNGLQDIYLDVSYTLKGIEGEMEFLNGIYLQGRYHEFSADEGNEDYGKEYGIYTRIPLDKKHFVEASFSDYQADSFSEDTRKFILAFGVTF